MDISDSNIKKARDAFDAYNVGRIFSANGLFSPEEMDFFAVIPLLLHQNYTIEGLTCPPETPEGIHFFDPKPIHIKAYSRLFPNGKLHEPSSLLPAIDSLSVMGSIGTIAQTGKSDFDYTIFLYQDRFTQNQADELQQKFDSIETWSLNTLNIEVHFFTQDIPLFKRNIYGITDKESVGSAEGKLFKDEYYRTSIVIAGKKPLWWIIPPELHEEEVDAFTKQFCTGIRDDIDEYVDLGHAADINPEEYFGAALWQLNKLFQSPHKSLLKMGLIESYLFYEEKGTLGDQLKVTLMQPGHDEYDVDPYILMGQRVVEYYKKYHKGTDIRILQMALLMKTGLSPDRIHLISTGNACGLSEKEKMIARLLREWHWTREDTVDFVKKIHSPNVLLSSTDNIYTFFLNIYVRLSDWLKDFGFDSPLISRKDMTVLGRRLFTYFENRAGKVRLIPPGNIPKISPKGLSLLFEKRKDGRMVWALYNFQLIGVQGRNLKDIGTPLTRIASLIEMLTWMVINKLWNPDIRLHMEETLTFNNKSINHILTSLYNFFISNGEHEPDRSAYTSAKTVVGIFCVINIGRKSGSENIERIDMIQLESWGEYMHSRKKLEDTARLIADNSFQSKNEMKPFFYSIITPTESERDNELVHKFYDLVNILIKKLEKPIKRRKEKAKLDTTPRNKVRLDIG